MEARDRWFHGIHAHSVPVPGASPLNKSGSAPGSSSDSRILALATPDDLVKLDLYGTLAEKHVGLTRRQVRLMYRDVRERTERVFAGLTPEQLRGKIESSLNPMDWGLGHIAHFYEFMILRLLAPGSEPVLPGHDVHALFDSFRAAHDDRWKPKEVVGSDPTLGEIRRYIADVTDRLVNLVGPDDDTRLDPVSTYLHVYGVVHEHWHVEDFIQTRHTLGYAQPNPLPSSPDPAVANVWGDTFEPPTFANIDRIGGRAAGAHSGFVSIPAGKYLLGATKDEPWVFDAERWAHEIDVPAFRIAKSATTNAEFAAFIAAGGYHKRELWSHEGWRWLSRNRSEQKSKGMSDEDAAKAGLNSEAPRYWVRKGSGEGGGFSKVAGGWHEHLFDAAPAPVRPHAPVLHVSWYEAEAYCAWVGGRLPTEAEWEVAARTEPGNYGVVKGPRRRAYPWGDSPGPDPSRANLDGFRGNSVDVGSLPDGDSAWGCRQMLGNAWEWTSSAFLPYPGFQMDFPYRENSAPWFGYRKVCKGGCWATSAPIARAGYRHSFWPEMNAVYTGFRVAVDGAPGAIGKL